MSKYIDIYIQQIDRYRYRYRYIYKYIIYINIKDVGMDIAFKAQVYVRVVTE